MNKSAAHPETRWAPTSGGSALFDLAEGLARWPLWTAMAWQDIKQRYRRSYLGPFWITLSMALLIATLGLLYGQLFGMELKEYFPYLTAGLLAWGLISSIMLEAGMVFVDAETYLKQMRLPLSLFVYQMVYRNTLIFFHNVVIFAVVAPLSGLNPGWMILWAIPGLFLVVVNGAWIALLLGLLCARFRDVPQMVTATVPVAFFLTPIIWRPEQLGGRTWIAEYNPFYYFVELIRAPLLGHLPSTSGLITIACITIGGCLTAFACFRWLRNRVVYWL